MKSKLIRYPFDEKKYRWDYWNMGKVFEYTWEKGGTKNFDTVNPYIAVEPYQYDSSKTYYYTDIVNPNKFLYDNLRKDENIGKRIEIHNIENSILDKFIYFTYNNLQPLDYKTFTITNKQDLNDVYTYTSKIRQIIAYRFYRDDFVHEIPVPDPQNFPCWFVEFRDFRTLGNATHLGYHYFVNDTNKTYNLNNFNDLKELSNLLLNNFYWGDITHLDYNCLNYEGNYNNVVGNPVTFPDTETPDVDYDISKIDQNKLYNYIIIKTVKENDENNFCVCNMIDAPFKDFVNQNQEHLAYTFSFNPDLYTYSCNNINFVENYWGDGPMPYKEEVKPYYCGKFYDFTRIGRQAFRRFRIQSNQKSNIVKEIEDADLASYLTNNQIPFENLANILLNRDYIIGLAEYSQNPIDLTYRVNNNTITIYDKNNNGFYNITDYEYANESWFGRVEGINYYGNSLCIFFTISDWEEFPLYTYGIDWHNDTEHNINILYTTIEYNKQPYPDVPTPLYNAKYLLLKEDWPGLEEGINCFKVEHNDIPSTVQYILKPRVELIGDTTADYVEIGADNQTILSYYPCDNISSQFVRKTLQFNPITSYEQVGDNWLPSRRTFLSYNSYSAAEWGNGYHLLGDEWNSIGSPFGYSTNIKQENESAEIVYQYDVCPQGKYLNILSINDGSYIEVKDTENNTFISKEDTVDDYKYMWNDGLIPSFDGDYYTSTNRHEYPDLETHNNYIIVLRPELTKFLYYYRDIGTRLTNVELFSDRYNYTQETVDLCDRTYEGTICGSTSSTGEENIPDANSREYKGLYLGDTILFLNIRERQVSPAKILGVPQYDKQVNTSDTLKYGTVASASLSFTLNMPVAEAMELNNELLVCFYQYTNVRHWDRIGFFRVDTIEAIDENTTSLIAHDETYKLNKYVDDFLENYNQTTTLDLFYRDLLNYCGCFYDTHQPIINNGTMNMENVYHAVKTTGIQVAHYIANLSPGFIHTNIDGDVVLSQYKQKNVLFDDTDYNNLIYSAYDSDILNKIKITSNNNIKGETTGEGSNTYYLADNPLLSDMNTEAYFNDLADSIYSLYENIPVYRPATVDFYVLPSGLEIGDIVTVKTPKNEEYSIIVMSLTVNSSGVEIKSFGTQKYPVEAESNSEFINLINDMGQISSDVGNLYEAQQLMAGHIAENTEAISNNSAEISNIKQKNTQQDTAISTNSNNISNLNTTISGYKSTQSNNLATIILSNTINNVALKDYVDGVGASTLVSAKSYTDSKVSTEFKVGFGTLTFTLTGSGQTTMNVMYIGSYDLNNGIMVPAGSSTSVFKMFNIQNGNGYVYNSVNYSHGAWESMTINSLVIS